MHNPSGLMRIMAYRVWGKRGEEKHSSIFRDTTDNPLFCLALCPEALISWKLSWSVSIAGYVEFEQGQGALRAVY